MPDLPPSAIADDPAFEERVIRAFVRGDRIVSIPARARKKLVILRFLLDRVLPDADPVAEPDLNMRLALWHLDVAALRRYLVDAHLATRSGMVYRRAVPPSPDRPGPDRASSERPPADRPPDRPGGPPFV